MWARLVHCGAERAKRTRTTPGMGRERAEARSAGIADDRPVSGAQGGASRLPAVLPPGRFLRAVLRGRQGRGAGARHRADQARPPRRGRHPDVRRAGAQRRGLSRAPDPPGLQGRDLRADRGSGRGQAPRRQGAGRARRGARGDARARSPRTACSMPGRTISWPRSRGARTRWRSPGSTSRPAIS